MGKTLAKAVGALVVLALMVPTTAGAATFTVDTTDDGPGVAADCQAPIPPATTCSVRDALAAASVSADPLDEVVIPAGTYVLTEGELEVLGEEVTLTGAGARETILDGNGGGRIFSAEAQNTTIRDLTVRNGFADFVISPGAFPGDGGGILAVGEELTLERVTVRGNIAELNGGGVAAPPESLPASNLTIIESTISNNRVLDAADPDPALESIGGGVQAFGDLAITNSTVSDNTIETPGATFGGGVALGIDLSLTDPLDVPSATIVSSTIAGNSVPASATGIGGGLGIFNPAALLTPQIELRNTIVAENTVSGAPEDCGNVGTPTSTNNLSSDSSCGFTDPGSQQTTNPQLAPLADNGGPTDTRALPAGSPAVNAGTNAQCPPVDQRGIARPQEANCDVGAFELVPAPPPPPPPAGPEADLAVSMKAKPKRPKAGKKVTYTVRVRNLGPDAAPGARIKGKLPIVTKKIKGRNNCTVRGNRPGKRKYTCPLGDLASGASAKLKLIARPDSRIRRPRATAKVTSDVPDPGKGNNRAKAVVRLK
jgi:hypothetical protein